MLIYLRTKAILIAGCEAIKFVCFYFIYYYAGNNIKYRNISYSFFRLVTFRYFSF